MKVVHSRSGANGARTAFAPAMWCLMSIAVAASLAVYDYIGLGLRPLHESAPRFGIYYLFRCAVLFACSAVLVVSAGRSLPPPSASPLDTMAVAAIYVSAVSAITAALVFLWDPQVFSRYAREDHFVEWASAVACFLASCAFLVAASRNFRRGDRQRVLGSFVYAGLALLMFFVGMEEISWTQRIVGFDTPALFDGNIQNEANLHNFVTDASENVYYTGAFVILIATPYLNTRYRMAVGPYSLADILPDRSVALVAAPFVAFNWDMWNIIPIQMALFVTVLALLADARVARRQNPHELNAVLAVVVVQGIFLAFGQSQVRSWDTTEYKELFIPMAFLFYALRVAAQSCTIAVPAAQTERQ